MLLKTYYKRDKETYELKIYHMLCVCQSNKDGSKIYASEFINDLEYSTLKSKLNVKELEYGKDVLDND